MKPATLQIKKPFGRTVGLALLFLSLFAGLVEWTTRQIVFQDPLTPPKMGSRHYQLGHKLALLDTDIKKNGPIECIMLGSSMVDVGFGPEDFQDAYWQTTGQRIRCFNFGIDASSAVSTSALMKILMDDYHPRIVILGTDPRDYAVPSNDRDPAAVLDTPWVQHRQGHFSLEGWLLDTSYFYRYRQHLSRLVRFEFEGTLWSETNLNFPIDSNGFTPLTKIAAYVNDPPDPRDTSYEFRYYKRIYSSYQMLDENLKALESMMEYNGVETQVIIVEMPVSDGLYYFFGNGEADYNQFVTRVTELANLYQIPFWQTEPLDSIPDDGWSDYSHLNVTGAEIFSTWLGEQVGRLDHQMDTEVSQP